MRKEGISLYSSLNQGVPRDKVHPIGCLVAAAILFAASDDAAFFHGENIAINGGITT